MASQGIRQKVYSVSMHPRFPLIAYGLEDSKVKIWDLQTQLFVALLPHSGKVFSVHFSQCGTYLASAGSQDSSDGADESFTINIWFLQKQSTVSFRLFASDVNLDRRSTSQRHQGNINSIKFRPLGDDEIECSELASGGSDNSVRLWLFNEGKEDGLASGNLNDEDGKEGKRYLMRKHKDEVTALDWSPGGELLVSGDLTGEIIVWAVKQRVKTKHTPHPPENPIYERIARFRCGNEMVTDVCFLPEPAGGWTMGMVKEHPLAVATGSFLYYLRCNEGHVTESSVLKILDIAHGDQKERTRNIKEGHAWFDWEDAHAKRVHAANRKKLKAYKRLLRDQLAAAEGARDQKAIQKYKKLIKESGGKTGFITVGGHVVSKSPEPPPRIQKITYAQASGGNVLCSQYPRHIYGSKTAVAPAPDFLQICLATRCEQDPNDRITALTGDIRTDKYPRRLTAEMQTVLAKEIQKKREKQKGRAKVAQENLGAAVETVENAIGRQAESIVARKDKIQGIEAAEKTSKVEHNVKDADVVEDISHTPLVVTGSEKGEIRVWAFPVQVDMRDDDSDDGVDNVMVERKKKEKLTATRDRQRAKEEGYIPYMSGKSSIVTRKSQLISSLTSTSTPLRAKLMEAKTMEPNEHIIVAGCFDEEVGIYKYPVVEQDDETFLLYGHCPQLLPMSDDPTPKAVILPEVATEESENPVEMVMDMDMDMEETVTRELVREEEPQMEAEDLQPYEHSKEDDVNFLKQAAADVSRAAPPAMAQIDTQQQASVLLRAYESLANTAEDEDAVDVPAPDNEESSCAVM